MNIIDLSMIHAFWLVDSKKEGCIPTDLAFANMTDATSYIVNGLPFIFPQRDIHTVS